MSIFAMLDAGCGYDASTMQFDEWLEEKLEQKLWSKAELSRRSGVSMASISKAKEKNDLPGFSVTNRLAAAFGQTAEEFAREWRDACGIFRIKLDLPPSVAERIRRWAEEMRADSMQDAAIDLLKLAISESEKASSAKTYSSGGAHLLKRPSRQSEKGKASSGPGRGRAKPD
jgi:transcriptional regulator with XRE-family HTH domain